MSMIELISGEMPSRMMARVVVLQAKAMLSAMPEVSQLTREGFITVCVEAALAFLREGEGGGGGGGGSGSGSDEHDSVDKSRMNSTDRCGLRSLSHYNTISGNGAALGRRQRQQRSSCSSGTLSGASKRGQQQQQQQPLASHFSEKDLKRLQRLLVQNCHSWSHDDMAPVDDADAVRFSTVPPAKVEATHIIKRVLDSPYRHGLLSRQQYSAIVLTVLEELFSDHVAVTSDAAMDIGGDGACGCSVKRNGSSKSNNEDDLAHEEMPSVNPPQDLQAPLRPDVVERTVQFAHRALQHFLGLDARVNTEAPRNEVEREEAAGGEEEQCEMDSLSVDGVSPLPRNPHHVFADAAAAAATTPIGALYRDSMTSLSSLSVHFDDAFEQQVEKLRRVLEEKYALDLSGARASGHRKDKNAGDALCNSVAGPAIAATSVRSSLGRRCVSDNDRDNNNNNDDDNDDARQRRDRLFAEMVQCQGEIQQTQTRLGSIVQELRGIEQASGAFSG